MIHSACRFSPNLPPLRPGTTSVIYLPLLPSSPPSPPRFHDTCCANERARLQKIVFANARCVACVRDFANPGAGRQTQFIRASLHKEDSRAYILLYCCIVSRICYPHRNLHRLRHRWMDRKPLSSNSNLNSSIRRFSLDSPPLEEGRGERDRRGGEGGCLSGEEELEKCWTVMNGLMKIVDR